MNPVRVHETDYADQEDTALGMPRARYRRQGSRSCDWLPSCYNVD